MKWFILMCVLGGDVLLLMAISYVFGVSSFLAILLGIPTYYAWKSTGGFSSYKLSTTRSFLRNWDNLMIHKDSYV